MKILEGIFAPEASFEVSEASTEVDGKYVLGRVAGQFFVPNGKSRNDRFYPRELWERCLADPGVKERMENRRMFGTAGHCKQLDDEALREGDISHIVTKLEIRGDVGYGEALILDTPVGRTLNTLLRAGCKLFVSSRANGSYRGKTEDGIPIVDPQTYELFTFDFVIEPGFLQANPSLVENQIQSPVSLGDSVMGAELQEAIDRLSRENGSMRATVESALKENEGLKAANQSLVAENKNLAIKADRNESMARQLERFKALGTVEEIAAMMDRAEKVIGEYRRMGSPASVQKALNAAHETLSRYRKMGTDREIQEALERASRTIEAYKGFGSIPEMNALLSRVEADQKKVSENRAKERVASLAKELSVSEDAIKVVYGKISEKEIRKLFTRVTDEDKETNRWRKPAPKMSEGKDPKSKTVMTEDSRGKRLMASLSR